MSEALADALAALLESDEPTVLVTLSEARGSTPREAGVAMLVTATDLVGTVGGGTYEWEGIAAARRLLRDGGAPVTIRMALGPESGQCCGGHVTLHARIADEVVLQERRTCEARDTERQPVVIIYGAGHVGRALALALDPLPFRTRIVDARAEEMALVEGGTVEQIVGAPSRVAAAAPPGAAHVVLTHSHALDSLVCAAVLERGDFAYLGLIGSATKRATFVRAFRDLGLPEAVTARLVCPIGGTAVRDKRPAVIAALVAAELVAVFASIRGEPEVSSAAPPRSPRPAS